MSYVEAEPHQRQPRSTPSPGSPAVMIRKYNVMRSCIRCHERKVRCNKETPCIACVRSEAQCRYPGPERAKRVKSRSQKGLGATTVATAAAEQPLVNGTLQDQHPSDARPAHQPSGSSVVGQSSITRPAPSESEQSGGFLLKAGTSTRYVNEFTFSRVLEKQGELQSAIDTAADHPSSASRLSAIGFDGLISDPRLSDDVSALLPTRWQATQLWQCFVNNVDSLVKLLHIPTIQPAVFAAINNPKDTAPDMNALLFAIYFSAVTSLRWTEVQTVLGQDRQAVLNAYQRGLELSLHARCFLDQPTILSLQAMALYLMSYRNVDSGRTGWILNGLLIRAAVAVGLHRDGAQFNLSPLDCEVRRRLWWQILGSDGRAAEDHGLAAGPTGGFDGFCDTKLPAHIDDRDVSPETTTPPASRQRWTELTHFLVASEMYQALQQINRLSASNGDDKMAKLQDFLKTLRADMHAKYLQYCDPNIPTQKCSLLLGRLLLGKAEVFVKQQALRGLSAEEALAHATDETLALACDSLELCFEMKTDELLGNFQWLLSTFTEYHLLTYALWHLCVRPGSPGADRAWTVVDKMFTLVEMQGAPGAKWNVLRKMREKAAGVRRGLGLGLQQGQERDGIAAGSAPLRDGGRQMGAGGLQAVYQNPLDVAASSPMFNDAMAWDLGYLVFPDWGGNPPGY